MCIPLSLTRCSPTSANVCVCLSTCIWLTDWLTPCLSFLLNRHTPISVYIWFGLSLCHLCVCLCRSNQIHHSCIWWYLIYLPELFGTRHFRLDNCGSRNENVLWSISQIQATPLQPYQIIIRALLSHQQPSPRFSCHSTPVSCLWVNCLCVNCLCVNCLCVNCLFDCLCVNLSVAVLFFCFS